MRIAGLQMAIADDDIEANHRKIAQAIESASQGGADILLTPEGSLSGYHADFQQTLLREALDDLRAQAQRARLGLALGTCCFEDPEHCYNQIRFYEKDGTYLGFHAKILLCSASLEPPYHGEITTFASKPLEVFRFQDTTIGGLICNDLWANPGCTPQSDPHLSQQLARMGASIIFHAINGGRGSPQSIALNRAYHESNQRLRAIAANGTIACVDNAEPLSKDNSCTSGVIGPDGEYLCQLPVRGEGLYLQEV